MNRTSRRCSSFLLCLFVLASSFTFSQTFIDDRQTIAIDPKRGVDSKLDYASLLAFGPWDDRNYQLTVEDLAWLAPNEAELDDLIPAFFRVQMRKAWPTLPREGVAQYPRHAYPTFLAMFGGFEVNGVLHQTVTRKNGKLTLALETATRRQAGEQRQPEPDAVSGEVRISSPAGAAETAIAINPVNVNRVIAGSNGPGGGQKMWYSSDGGSTWSQATLPLGSTNGDPAVAWSSNGQFAYTTTLGNCSFFGCGVWFYRSADNGATWTSLETLTPGDPRREITNSNGDREFIHVDRSPSSSFKDRIYVFHHEGNVMQIARSADFGNTFTKLSFPNLSDERGIAGDVTTDPAGNVYYIWPAFNSRRVLMKKSTNGGASFGSTTIVSTTNASFTFPLPSMEARDVAVYVSADTDLSNGTFRGSIYAAWTDNTNADSSDPAQNHGRIVVARSRDGGSSWQFSTPHETADQNTVDRYHQFLSVGEDGTVHVVFYDSRRDPTRNAVDVYYTYSTNGAVSWTTPQRVTTAQSPNLSDGFEFGDYNGLDIVASNLIAIYTDNRDESGGTAASKDAYGIGITPGSSGSGGAGHVPDGKLTPGPQLQITKAGANLNLNWGSACGGGTDYATYEGELGVQNSFVARACSSGGTTSITITPSSGNRSYVIVPLVGDKEGSYGRRSTSEERSPAAASCQPQLVLDCP